MRSIMSAKIVLKIRTSLRKASKTCNLQPYVTYSYRTHQFVVLEPVKERSKFIRMNLIDRRVLIWDSTARLELLYEHFVKAPS